MARDPARKPAPAKPPAAASGQGRDAPTGPLPGRGYHVAAGAIAIFMFIVVWTLSGSEVAWPTDHFSDMNVLMSGENFATVGFWKLKFLPVHYVGGIGERPDYYLHYPPLPNIVNGMMRVVGIESLSAMRVLCGMIFIAGTIFLYLAFAREIGPLGAVVGLAFAATTGYFFSYSISVHQHCYNVFFLGVFVWLLVQAVHRESPPRWMWGGAWAALMLESLASFDFILFPQIFAWVYVLALGQFRKRRRALLLLATAPVVGQGLHLLQNILAVGWDRMMRDGLGYGMYAPPSRWASWVEAWDNNIGHSMTLYFWPWTLVLVLGTVWVGLIARQQAGAPGNARRLGALVLGLAAASLGWSFAMPSHTGSHPHTASQFFPLVFAVMGGVGAMLLQWLLKRDSAVTMRVLAGAGCIVLALAQYENIKRATQQRGVLYSVMLTEAIGGNALPEKVGVLGNMDAEAQFAYFIRRPAWRCPNWPAWRNPFPDGIPDLRNHLPPDWELKYYLFNGRGYKGPQEDPWRIFRILASNCPGRIALPLPAEASPEHVEACVKNGLYVILFDISALHPGYQGPPLDPAVRERQLRWEFPRWDVPGFADRWNRIVDRAQRQKR